MAASDLNQVGDGCTGWFDGNWRACCDVHDYAYAIGLDKLQADLGLGLCVAKMGHPLIGLIMFLGVAAFGGLFWKKPKETQ